MERIVYCERHNKPMEPIKTVQKGIATGWSCRKCEREWITLQRKKARAR